MNQIKNLSLIGICMAFVVIALGAWTRLVDAGLGCPDWPGCYGFVFWPNDEVEIPIAESRFPTYPYDINKAIPEQVHRLFAAALGFIAILLVFLSSEKTNNKSIQRWTIFLLILICCQGLFGYLTVSNFCFSISAFAIFNFISSYQPLSIAFLCFALSAFMCSIFVLTEKM